MTKLTPFLPFSVALHLGLVFAAVYTHVPLSAPLQSVIRVRILPPGVSADITPAAPPQANMSASLPAPKQEVLPAARKASPRPPAPRAVPGPKRRQRPRATNPGKVPQSLNPESGSPSTPAVAGPATGGGESSIPDARHGGPGGGGDPDDVLRTYIALVRSLIDAQKHYPEEARRARTQGTAVVAFVVSPSGEIRDLRIVSADDTILGTAALRALKQAARHIGPPPTGTAIPMEIALRFELATERQ